MSAHDQAIRVGGVVTALLLRFMPMYGDRFESCWTLYQLSENLVKRQHHESAATPQDADVVIWGIGTRSIQTYKSVLYLAGMGLGAQALMLNRSLIESVLSMHWAAQNRKEALRRMALNEEYTKHLWRDIFAKRDLDAGSLSDLPPLSDLERKEMASLFGMRGTKSWTGLTTYALHNQARSNWGDENERTLLDHVAAVSLKHTNLQLHSSPSSILRPQFPDDETVYYDAGESEEHIAGALLIAFWAFAHSARLLLATPYRSELIGFYNERMPTLFRA